MTDFFKRDYGSFVLKVLIFTGHVVNVNVFVIFVTQ
jgi:hypothetical protein